MKNKIQGRVIVSFVINGDGTLSEFKVEHSVAPDIDAEALRVLQMSPKWLPAIINSQTVRVLHYVPIDFIIKNSIRDGNEQTNDNLNQLKNDSVVVGGALELAPSFQGRIEHFSRYLKRYLRYPESARKSGLEGQVIVTFVIERDGSLTSVKIVKGLSPDIDAEAIRLMAEGPKWKPGTQNGNVVKDTILSTDFLYIK